MWCCKQAYEIRLIAINEFGRVIHEFDPYFNYRATEYLWEHGATDFFKWFDYMVWYPLGRPVGTTIYPGMQFTSVFVKMFILPDWSINDICCFVPAWFGVLATLSVALLAYECSTSQEPFGSIFNDVPIINVVYRNTFVPVISILKKLLVKLTGSSWGLDFTPQAGLECALFSAAIMAIVPAHLMRSIGGGYDNESIATTAMTLTFYLWTRSLRGTTPNYFWAVLSGLAYFYMVAAWGGYVFVINLIGLHASLLVAFGRYSTKLHRAYTLFYLVGTALAIQVPVVGWTPLRSLEQMGPLLAFCGFQLIELCEIIKRRRKLSTKETWKLRVQVFSAAALVGALVLYLLAPTGYFGPISSRVRGLFVKHTKTGNPLVDSVAEHQPASPGAYFQYLQNIMYIAPVGLVFVALFRMNDASSFLLVYGAAAYFFSHRMVRLILLTAPIASVLAGIALGNAWAWGIGSLSSKHPTLRELFEEETEEEQKDEELKKDDASKDPKRKQKISKKPEPEAVPAVIPQGDPYWVRAVRLVTFAYLVNFTIPYATTFYKFSYDLGKQLSNPTIIFKAQTRDGLTVTIDDYREAYLWLRDNTPEDARIMAWWDYGYQITGISNRTTIADGNTWNHEHIALLGRTLTSPEKEGHRIARHLADYVLVWAGGGGDDLAKSTHLARIANSVYRHMCPGDPTCRTFGFSVSILCSFHAWLMIPTNESFVPRRVANLHQKWRRRFCTSFIATGLKVLKWTRIDSKRYIKARTEKSASSRY
jgi:dolichyl-diphosphooligosaccharide--protein glycosyltransferase